MLEYFDEPRKRIRAWLEEQRERKGRALGEVNSFGPDVAERLYRFAQQGKMIRGGLVFLGFDVTAQGPAGEPAALVQAAGAIELFQSGLLVHDDIMDGDPLRRGQKTLHAQYAEAAGQAGAADPARLGEGLGICAGDVGYFLAFEALAAMSAPPEAQRRVLELCARELSFVGVAQMQDLHNGACPAEVTDEQVLRLHLYKTGRYSFSLPLMVGALLAGAPELALQHLEKLGGLLGVLFQIRDDELGLFGDTHRIGKPAGSDVREGKKTLYYSHLLRRAAGADRRRLDAIYGHPDSGPQELAFVRELATRLGVREAVAAAARGLAQEAGQMIQSLPVHREEHRQVFEQLLAFAQERPS